MLFSIGTARLSGLAHYIVSASFLTSLGVDRTSQWRSTWMVPLFFLVHGLRHIIRYLNYAQGRRKNRVDGIKVTISLWDQIMALPPNTKGAPKHIFWGLAHLLESQAAETGAEPIAAPRVDKPHKPESASVSSSYHTKGTTLTQQSSTIQAAEECHTQHSQQEHERAAPGVAARGAPGDEEKALKNSASVHRRPALAMRTLLRKGFGDDVPPHVLQCVQKGPKKYPMAQVLQANMKIHTKITPTVFPPDALKLLASLLEVRDPLLWVRNSAMREGCILVTLDVMQLAGILSNVQQEMRQRGRQPEGDMHGPAKEKESCAGATGEECFRRLQQHVAAAGQAWLRNVGLENELEHGTLMSVQVLDCMHRFTWGANAASWEPCGSELLPFGSQHSIIAHSPVALLPSIKECLPPELTPPPPPHGKQHSVGTLQSLHNKAAVGDQPVSAQKAVDLELEVCTSPGQVVVGWGGGKQEQQVNAQSGVSAVQLLARMEGCHVPVTILECEPTAVVTDSPASQLPKQKQVVHVRMECTDQPHLVEFELWQQHFALAPACGVLLLPDSLAEVARELDAWVRPLWDFKEHASKTVDWDCAAAPDENAAPESNDISEAFKQSRANWGFADFVADLGYWLEASNNAGPSPSMRCAKAAQQQDENRSMLFMTGRQLLNQSISWGLCNVADLVLQGMLREPFSLSFTELANGESSHAHPNNFEENMVGSFDASSIPRCSSEGELDNCSESLLQLALLSRSSAMFRRMLEWGRTYGNPSFEWDWFVEDINGITPLQRMQVLCSTHPEMLEMALADTHAGPGLLACWLQERPCVPPQQGPIGKLPPQHSIPSTQAPTSPSSASAADLAAAPAATQASSSRSAAQASSSSSADVRHGHQAAGLAAASAVTQASSSSAPPTPAYHTRATEVSSGPQPSSSSSSSSSSSLLKGGTAPAPGTCALADTLRICLPYFVWLLRSEIWGFRGGDVQAAGLGPEAACAFGFCQEVANPVSPVQQQQQQQQWQRQQVDKENAPSNTAELSVINSESQCALSEVQYRAWAMHRAAPWLQKLSMVSTVLPLLLLASPLMCANSVSEIEWHLQQPAAPFCCALSLLSLTTLVLASKLNTTVTPQTLQAWLSIAAMLRAIGYILLGSGILQGSQRLPGFGSTGCIVLLWEAAASVVEQVPFFLGVAVRVPLIAIHAILWVKGAPSLAVPAVLLHSACAALWLAHGLMQRSAFISVYAAPKACKAQ